jgi:hypothetical protein
MGIKQMVSLSTLVMMPMMLVPPQTHLSRFLFSSSAASSFPFSLCARVCLALQKKKFVFCGLLFTSVLYLLYNVWTRIDGNLSFPGLSQIVLSHDLRLSAAFST